MNRQENDPTGLCLVPGTSHREVGSLLGTGFACVYLTPMWTGMENETHLCSMQPTPPCWAVWPEVDTCLRGNESRGGARPIRFPDFRIRMRRAQTVRYRYRSGKITYTHWQGLLRTLIWERGRKPVFWKKHVGRGRGWHPGHSQRAFRPDGLPVPRARSLCDSPALEICEIALTPHIELHLVLKPAGVGFCFM